MLPKGVRIPQKIGPGDVPAKVEPKAAPSPEKK